MELKLVYRALRKISDWALAGFYSEVYVGGQENVPESAPLIIASSHHNEIIDIATLAATIPYRRHLCFWAKSSMFRNPLVGQVLLSSGAIPVYRNPNSASSSEEKKPRAGGSLFDSSSAALARGDVLGVFPEGTSYTEPRIVQVKDGAARAAVEYAKYIRAKSGKTTSGLVIIPVGITYTDKSQYQSRVVVRYGAPIAIDDFAPIVIDDCAPAPDGDEAREREAVRAITTRIEAALVALTINAPSDDPAAWAGVYAARAARDMLWRAPERVALRDWVPANQTLVDVFAEQPDAADALVRYYSLLHYTGLAHGDLPSALPAPPRALGKLVVQTIAAALHPKTLLFLPTFVTHIPAYALGLLAAKLFAPPGEEEAPAQFKVVFGGLGMALVYVPGGFWAARRLLDIARSGQVPVVGRDAALCVLDSLYGRAGVGRARETIGLLGVTYVCGIILAKWHNAFVGDNYRRWKRLAATFKLFLGSMSSPLSAAELTPYLAPPMPPVNPFIKRRSAPAPLLDSRAEGRRNTTAGARRLMAHLLAARAEAMRVLDGSVRGMDGRRREELRMWGAAV